MTDFSVRKGRAKTTEPTTLDATPTATDRDSNGLCSLRRESRDDQWKRIFQEHVREIKNQPPSAELLRLEKAAAAAAETAHNPIPDGCDASL